MQNFEILFEDDDLVAINKPAGVVVNDAQTTQTPTIQTWMRERMERLGNEAGAAADNGSRDPSTWSALLPADFSSEYGEPADIFAQRQGLVHRLDKDTSGVLLLAKNPGALVNLLQQFRQRQVQKTYQCLVHGVFSPRVGASGSVNVPLARASGDRKKFAVVAEGRAARTDYSVEQSFAGFEAVALQQHLVALHPGQSLEKLDDIRKELVATPIYQGFSLLTCQPQTGRTHQIRVHLAHIKHPLVGDTTYLGKKRAKLDPWWCRRHFLHASNLTFQHPRTGQMLSLSAELTADLGAVLTVLA